ncbi:pyridoxamine 5'-phosphate oxidase family protein [Hydrogenophaga sp.]|uniref:HugZ family pyridoxamine 5'-phosphate oxidase n=1 Tax=Hydrogenophaga sp. TaxID=1904254 RepID=UPI00261B56AF|nr:pyridoxamine 5'-phosphate oxidase family protein [Hydrogenophaga sp.]MCW5653476.1 pyridoxamine 5'-phosphate oxidase family protein [Hydrogenophaga sp.]
MSSHEPRLSQALRELLTRQRVGALGTLGMDGAPWVSLVPFAVDTALRVLVLHVSALAQHTANLRRDARASLLVSQAEVAGEPVHALPRAMLVTQAQTLESGSEAELSARNAYLQRFPEAAHMTALGDFSFVALTPLGARQVAGFGAARSLEADEVVRALRLAP